MPVGFACAVLGSSELSHQKQQAHQHKHLATLCHTDFSAPGFICGFLQRFCKNPQLPQGERKDTSVDKTVSVKNLLCFALMKFK